MGNGALILKFSIPADILVREKNDSLQTEFDEFESDYFLLEK